MKTLTVKCVVLASLVAFNWLGTAHGASPSNNNKTNAASKIVIDVLQREAREAVADRTDLLKPALDQAPNLDIARWNSGFFFDTRQKQWLRYDEAPAAAKSDDRFEIYRTIRTKYPETVDGQMELARWCLKRNLADQARAHLTKVLELNQDHAEARRLLGYRLEAGIWISENDISQAELQAKKDTAALLKWKPKLEKIRKNLDSGKRQRDVARSELMAIRDPEAAGAIELVLCVDGGQTATMGIEALKNITGRESAAALIRLAMFAPWEPFGQAAARALRSQRKHDYVPQLLSLAQTPVQEQAQIYQSFGNGTLFYRHVFYREGRDQREMAVVDTPYQHVFSDRANASQPPRPSTRPIPGTDTIQDRTNDLIKRKVAMERFQADATQKASQREAAVARYNMTAEVLNSRICSVLSEATLEPAQSSESSVSYDETSIKANQPKSPLEWSKWWNDYNEAYVPERSTRTVYVPNPIQSLTSTPSRIETYTPQTLPPPSNSARIANSSIPRGITVTPGRVASRYECLAGDTIVWTETGPMPIKDVAAGDRVFACDVETGCLALKPVLRKTIRPIDNTGELAAITADGKTMLASGGHVFWVSGKGWTLARDLKAGMRLHTLMGSADIETIELSAAQETYNLIVADFHTFFAGDVKTLTHDNTMREPTNMVVPGLSGHAD